MRILCRLRHEAPNEAASATSVKHRHSRGSRRHSASSNDHRITALRPADHELPATQRADVQFRAPELWVLAFLHDCVLTLHLVAFFGCLNVLIHLVCLTHLPTARVTRASHSLPLSDESRLTTTRKQLQFSSRGFLYATRCLQTPAPTLVCPYAIPTRPLFFLI